MNLNQDVLAKKDYCIGLRRWFHAHPEPSLEEFETANRIESELDKIGITHTRVGDTGVYATLKGKKGDGKVLIIRADTDALRIQDLKECEYKSQKDGLMHACGHDAHTSVLLTLASILKEKENDFAGEIRFFFQQSEENGQGARQFVKAGLCKGADRVIGYHGNSTLDVGTVSCTPGPNNASCDFFRITVKGKSAHVSKPHQSIDALVIASQIVVNLQSIVARNTDPLDTVVVGIGVCKAGTTYNIVAEDAVLEGTTRTFNAISREKTNGLVTSIAKDIAKAYGGSAEVHFENFANPLINNDVVTEEMALCAEKVIGKENVIRNQVKRLDADDMADFLQEVPGTYMFVGTRNQTNPDTASAHHNGHFDIDENSMLIAASCLLQYTNEFFNI